MRHVRNRTAHGTVEQTTKLTHTSTKTNVQQQFKLVVLVRHLKLIELLE